MWLFVLLSLLLSVVALVRVGRAEQEIQTLHRRVRLLRSVLTPDQAAALQRELELGAVPEQAPAMATATVPATSPAAHFPADVASGLVPTVAPSAALTPAAVPTAPIWPEDWERGVRTAPPISVPNAAPSAVSDHVAGTGTGATSSAPFAAETPSFPNLWGPEFSRARISIIGGALVLAGLAFTLRELGLPAWTSLLAVFAFGGLLYGTGRLVPWPVSGALRGLGYGVTALGLGSLAQKLPGEWGAGAVMLGLLSLSTLLIWDGMRRREPLLGVLAVAGAALSGWMLTDDLGQFSVLAVGAALGLGGIALSGWPTTQPDTDAKADPWPAARALLLAICASVPVGWLVASLSHWSGAHWADVPHQTDGAAQLFQVQMPAQGLLCWLVFSVLALTPGLMLAPGLTLASGLTLWRERHSLLTQNGPLQNGLAQVAPSWLLLPAAAALLLPQWLVAGALGAALHRAYTPVTLLLGLLPLLLVGVAAALTWRERERLAWSDDSLGGTLSSSLTAAASGLFSALVLALLGGGGEYTALSGLGLTLLLLGVYGQSRLWTVVGAVGSALVAAWAVADLPAYPVAQALLLAALPALMGLRGAWALLARPLMAGSTDALLLAGWCGWMLLGVAEAAGLPWLLALMVGFMALLWGLTLPGLGRVPFWNTPQKQIWWAAATLPALLFGSWSLIEAHTGWALLVALLGAFSVLRNARLLPRLAPLTEGLALSLLVLGLARLVPPQHEMLEKMPLALALTALLAAALPLKLPPRRVDVLLGLGAGSGVLAALWRLESGYSSAGLAVWLGIVALLPVWFLTRTEAGQNLLGHLKTHLLPPDSAPVRTLWLAGLLMLAVNTTFLLYPHGAGFPALPMTAASLVGLGIGLHAAVTGHRQGTPQPRTLWTVGLGLMLFAGFKAATLDALTYANAGAAAGLAVLVTGLSLLLVAIFAPRPAEAE